MTPPTQLAHALRYAFDRTRARHLRTEDFVRVLSFDRGWLAPRLVRLAVERATDLGLLEPSGQDAFAPGFDLEALRLGLDYAPDAQRLADELDAAAPSGGPRALVPLFRRLVRRVASHTHQTDAEVVAAVNRQQAVMGGLLTAEAAGLLYARLQNVDVDDLTEEAWQALLTPRSTPGSAPTAHP